VIELRTDKAAGCYVTTTLEGRGAGTEIRVMLAPVEPDLTDVAVEFHLPEDRPERLELLGQAYAQTYARLWDEDEAMMQERERMLRSSSISRSPSEPVDLGTEAEVRARLPLTFSFGGQAFRLVELNGALVAHATTCPHWLGPLGDAPVVDGQVRCPWHGYAFDVATGACLTKPSLTLERAPAIVAEQGRVWACAAPPAAT
jgi:nitrite reductase (NADH) small subunit